MRAAKLQSLKKLWLASNVALKTVIASSIVLIVVAIALFAPWYSVTTSQVVPEIQNYTTQFEEATTNYQTVTIYTMPNPVNLPTPYFGFWLSQSFELVGGSTYNIYVTECTICYLVFEEYSSNVTLFTMGSGERSFVAPMTGSYDVLVQLLGLGSGTIYSVTITQVEAQSTEVAQTLTTYSTTNVTQYSQTTVPPYTILGAVASTAILILLALILVLSILVNQGIITLSTKHRKTTKRRKKRKR